MRQTGPDFCTGAGGAWKVSPTFLQAGDRRSRQGVHRDPSIRGSDHREAYETRALQEAKSLSIVPMALDAA